MTNSTMPLWKTGAVEGLLATLITQLEAAIELVASADGPQRMDDILGCCTYASAMAKATRTVLAQGD
jgi:hypothetical protein